jgi:4-amino-4-deoxy-L-arabinose transferase-like glycosyltransferase
MPTGSPSFEQDARKIATALERHRYLVLALLTIVYAFGAGRHAANKPLWYDEIITVISASAPDVAGTWRAAQATDASPPLLHLLTHFSMQWFGSSEVAIRLPAIVGFWIFCLCLFQFVRRRAGIYFGFAALLMPIATEAYTYSYDARAYGPELAFCGLMLVAWQMAAEGRRQLVGCVLLALSLAGAMLLQYYAVLLYLPLAGAELFRSWRWRRWNWGIWAAFACGIAPLAWRIATVRHIVNQFSQTTWAPAYPEQVVEYWETMLQHSLSFVVVGLTILALRLIGDRTEEEAALPPKVAGHELVAGVLFLAIPVVAVAIGLFKTHMFTPRYALIGVTGVLLLVPMMAARLANGRAFAGFLLVCVTALPLVFVMLEVPSRNPVAEESTLVKALEQGPVVVPDGQLFLQMWYYTPPPLKSKLLFLLDAEAAVQYMGFDAIDVGIGNLRPWSSMPAVNYKDYAMPGREFRLYQNSMRPGWVLAKVVADGGSAQIEQYATYRQLVHVRLKE